MMHCYRLSIGALAILSAFSATCMAADEAPDEELLLAYGDKDSVSIATGSRQPLRRAPSVATVITAEDIAATGATDLDEVLESVPGVHVTRQVTANTAHYAIRGILNLSNNQVLLLQNGVPMTTMFLGNKGGVWGGLPLENVARIEIIRGPSSALYGADAYSGVINVITKNATEINGTQFGVRTGSFASRDIWALHGGRMGPVEVAAYLRFGQTDGGDEIIVADAQTLRDRLTGTRASLAPGRFDNGRKAIDGGLDLAYDKWHFRVGYKLRDDMHMGAGVNSSLDPDSRARSERINADLSWANPYVSNNWGLGFTASYLEYNDTIPTNLLLAPPGARLGAQVFPEGMIGGPNKWERQARLSGFATFTGFADHSLRFGAGHDDLDLYRTATYKNFLINQTTGAVTWTGPVMDYTDIQPFMTPHRRQVDYAYAQDEWHFGRDWTLTAGVRHDRYSDVGGTTNPRVALVWDASLDVTVKLLAGRAFRPPSFNELYGINNPVNKGNPELRPETIRTEEAAISWRARQDLQISLNVFRYTMDDIIRAVPDSAGSQLTTFQNSGVQEGRGGELEAVWDANRRLRFSASYSNQRSVDQATDSDAGYIPHHHVYARGDWRFANGWQASAQVNRVADRKRAYGDTRPNPPDYTTVDLTLRTEDRNDKWRFAGSIRNLFDSAVLEPSLAPGTAIPYDLPQPGRSVWLQASHRL